MIGQIALAAIASLTAISWASLRLVDSLDKRMCDERTPAPRPPEEKDGAVILPFARFHVSTRCPRCGVLSAMRDVGPRQPKACPDPIRCEAQGRAHLHVFCASCLSSWLMAPANHRGA